MKKIIFTFVALLACTLSASAQKVFSNSYFFSIPKYFTYDNKPYLSIAEEDGYVDDDYIVDNVTIYDMELNLVEKFKLGTTEGCYLDGHQFIDKDGVSYDLGDGGVYLTQTFFNDDADWEYVVPVKQEFTDEWGTYYRTVAYNIKKTNGTVIGSISRNKWELDYSIIGDVVYPITYKDVGDDWIFSFYTLPEFRKLISNDPSGVEAVPAMVRTISKEAYDLMGRKASDHHKGIVIKDGKKMINK